jgi:S-adenosylmethionine/arginine decarboxylase-like enzyme
MAYGPELIVDLYGCDISLFSRKSLRDFGRGLCKAIGMTPCKFRSEPWDDDGVPLEECQSSPITKGYTAIQFLMESSILIHTLELTGAAYINIFSCNPFDRNIAKRFAKEWFNAKRATSRLVIRG